MFIKAMPVWLKNKENEMNVAASFTERIDSLEGAEIRIAACNFYRIYVGDAFVAFGPARTAGGYARVDVIPLSRFNSKTGNTVRIEVVAYNCRSLTTCKEHGFLTAEIRRGNDVIAYTGRDFTSALMKEKEQYVERFSVQRHFTEVWDYTKNEEPMDWVITENTPQYLERRAPYPVYNDVGTDKALVRGAFSDSGKEPERPIRYSWNPVPRFWGEFKQEEIKYKPFRFVMRQNFTSKEKGVSLPLTLKAGEYALLDMKQIECGFLRFSGKGVSESDVVIGFSEYFEGETFDYANINCHTAMECILPKGFDGEWLSFEPHTLRFGIVMVRSGEIVLSSFGVKTYERDMSALKPIDFPTEAHRKIYNAAVRTFAHNAVDIYTDCPSRERAGWLCDSYFTATVEDYFFGKVPVEDDFLENFRLCTSAHLPRGLVPMCYPADIPFLENGVTNHIPQWCMWYVLELKEYLTKRNKNVDKELFRDSVEGLINYLELYENEDGLLEDLPGWNFVEWSDANSWTQNINYPTNFLYAATLIAADELYGKPSYKERGKRLQKKTAELSFDGELFTDNAVRDGDGVLKNTGNTSEACQYYAYLFGNIDLSDKKYGNYKKHLVSGCKETVEKGRKITPVNAFIGLYLRIKSLLAMERYDVLLNEVEGFLGGMADKTGTLWENRTTRGSLDHGFASYAAYAMCVALEHTKGN